MAIRSLLCLFAPGWTKTALVLSSYAMSPSNSPFLWPFAGPHSNMPMSVLYWETQNATQDLKCGLTSVSQEEKDHFPQTSGYVFAKSAQDAVGPFLLQGHTDGCGSSCPPAPSGLFCKVAFSPPGPASVLLVWDSFIQDTGLHIFLRWTSWGPHQPTFQAVEVLLNSSPAYWPFSPKLVLPAKLLSALCPIIQVILHVQVSKCIGNLRSNTYK